MTRKLAHAILATAAVTSVSAIVACGGGGAGSSIPGSSSNARGTASITIAIPSAAAGASSSSRVPAFVSPNAQSVSIVVTAGTASPSPPTIANLTSTSPNCTPANGTLPLTCTVTLNPPAGDDDFAVTLFQGLNATGNVLSTATVSAIVNTSGSTVIPVALGGVVTSIAVSVTKGINLIPGGYATSLPVIVAAKDPSGATIVGPGNYSVPITLSDADTSGITTLSTTTVTSPSTVVTLNYAPTDANTGNLNVAGLPQGSTTIGASATGIAPLAITAGTFQYITDSFHGFGLTRTLNGTGTVTTVSYNTSGVATGTTVFTYNITEAITNHAGATFNGISTADRTEVDTYAQTSPVTATPAETRTNDDFRQWTLTPTGAILYDYGQNETNVNSGAINSPITGYIPGTVAETSTFPATGAWEEDFLPHATASWSNSNVPLTEVYSNAEVATFQINADGSTLFNETVPSSIVQTQTASGAATNSHVTGFPGGNIGTAAVNAPVGGLIPVVTQQTTPSLMAPISANVPDWYPGGAAPQQPPYAYTDADVLTPIPGSCNVPATIGTQAYAISQTRSEVRVTQFQNRQQSDIEYYVPNSVGYVCHIEAMTITDYRFGSGIILSQSVIATVYGVQSVGNLGLHRRP